MLRRALLVAAAGLLAAAGPAGARVAPVAALSGPATIRAGSNATFDASSSTHDPAGAIVEYAWDLDGSGRFDDVRKTPTITTRMDTPGPVTVSVRVTDDAGATSTALGHFLVEGAPPVPRLAVPSPVTAGIPVTLDASASSSASGEIVDYAWDLDGAGFARDTGADPTLTATFPAAGTVTMRLRVRDSATGEAVLTRKVTVLAPSEQAPSDGLAGDPARGIAPLDAGAQRWIDVGSRAHFAAVNGTARRRLGAVRAHGLWVNLLADRAVTFRLRVFVRRAAGRRLGLRGKVAGRLLRIARTRTALPHGGQRPLRLILPRRVRRALRGPVTLLVRGTATDAQGRRARVARAFALRR